MQRNDNILEEEHVFVTQGYGESRDDGREDIQQLSSTIELVRFMDQRIKGLVHGLSDHFTSGHELQAYKILKFKVITYLGIKFMQNVLQVVTLHTFFRVEKLKDYISI